MGIKRFNLRKYCSNLCAKKVPWNKGIKYSKPVWNKGLKTNKPAWNTGKKMPNPAWNKGLSWNKWMSKNGAEKALKNVGGKPGDRHWNWQGGISESNHLFRHTKEYKEWRAQVFRRDGWSCVICGYRSCKPRDIRADHIKPFSKFPELRLEVSNGRTLCLPCDLKHGWQLFREENPRSKRVVT